MSEQTKIAWCDSTLNFWDGCDKVSPGCANCYITSTPPFRVSGRRHGDPRALHESAFKLAVRLNKKPWVCDCGKSYGRLFPNVPALGPCSCGRTVHRRRIFSLSLGDWLDPEVPAEWLARMLDTIRQCDRVTWILCSKRLELWRERTLAAMEWNWKINRNVQAVWLDKWRCEKPPKNVILLASVENQAMADKRVPELQAIPAAVRGLSCEPLLGPIKFRTPADLTKIGWVIAGGESGRNARPCNVEWIRSIKNQCQAAGVPVFVKQAGSNAWINRPEFHDKLGVIRGPMVRLDTKHPKGGDPAEWPDDLRVQQFPKEIPA